MNEITIYYKTLEMLDKDINILKGELEQLTITRNGIEKKLRDAEHAEYVASIVHDVEEDRKNDEFVTEEEYLMDKMIKEQEELDMLEDAHQELLDMEERTESPEFIIASISEQAEETLVFEATSNGDIKSFNDYGGLARRWGNSDWRNVELAVKSSMKDTYMKVSCNGNHTLFKLVTAEEAPDEFTYWDGDIYDTDTTYGV